MHHEPLVVPVAISTQSLLDGKIPTVSTTAIRSKTTLHATRTESGNRSEKPAHIKPQAVAMSGLPGSTVSPPDMFVRALYDYDADDHTSLSFREGDIIRVLTQLESGWWDGVINDERGWFPSNYCVVITVEEARRRANGLEPEASGESGTEDESEEEEEEQLITATTVNGRSNQQKDRVSRQQRATAALEQEEAAFWIPQATPDGRLFYYNTLTGVSTMELPLETPTSANETGPRDRMNVRAPEQTRPPPEMMAGGYGGQEEDGVSDSEAEGGTSMHARNRSTNRRRRGSQLSDGVSPAVSMESLNTSPEERRREHSRDFHPPYVGGKDGAAQYAASVLDPAVDSTADMFFDDGKTPPMTWNRLIDNMRRSVEAYRQAINNSDRSDYVRKAEDISDHLRMLLAAGSGTTDNHSGNPSIISTNTALYPHFRDMMSRFSKLVLSSHIAAADWPSPDSYSKCLQEAEGVMNGVYGYVEVARTQRGDEIPRLAPGFILGKHIGGGWTNNVSKPVTSSASSFADDELDSYNEPLMKLDPGLLDRIDELMRMLNSSICRVEESLVFTDKIVTPEQHHQISETVCSSASKLVEVYRPLISLVESIDLVPPGVTLQPRPLTEFAAQKQQVYDLVADFVISCQAVAGPLSDEWCEIRGEPLENKLADVRAVLKQFEQAVSQVRSSLQQFYDNLSPDNSKRSNEMLRRIDGSRDSTKPFSRAFGKGSSIDGLETPQLHNRPVGHENSKIKQFFGEVPKTATARRNSDETPSYLQLEHEGEISYDTKTDPPQLRGGTLVALVEQLTRHDRLDSAFNNTFLLTYRSFTTAQELFEMLVKRFSIQPPRGITQDQYHDWVDKKQKLIRLRVVNILKTWLDHYWMEGNDPESNELLRRVYSFAKDSIATTNTGGAAPLMALVEQRMKGQDNASKRLVLNLNGPTPTPIIPKNMKKLKFLDIDPTEFARQLTILESRLYGKIKPTECLNKTWQKKITPEEPDPAPNVKALILHSNQLTNWVAEMILTQPDLRKRTSVIKHYVNIADKCRALNNFSTLTSIISAFSTAPIHRLSRTWQQVNAKTTNLLESLRNVMNNTKNWAEYRETLHLANPPCIPFFGVYLTDLIFIEDGIPSVIKRTNLINFNKRAKTAEVIRDIQQYQNVPYPLQPVPELQDYILSNMQAAGDVHEMYDRSLVVEPREREDEKIARLLSESGFL